SGRRIRPFWHVRECAKCGATEREADEYYGDDMDVVHFKGESPSSDFLVGPRKLSASDRRMVPLGGVEWPRRVVRAAQLIQRRVRAFLRTYGRRRLQRQYQPDLPATKSGAIGVGECAYRSPLHGRVMGR